MRGRKEMDMGTAIYGKTEVAADCLSRGNHRGCELHDEDRRGDYNLFDCYFNLPEWSQLLVWAKV